MPYANKLVLMGSAEQDDGKDVEMIEDDKESSVDDGDEPAPGHFNSMISLNCLSLLTGEKKKQPKNIHIKGKSNRFLHSH